MPLYFSTIHIHYFHKFQVKLKSCIITNPFINLYKNIKHNKHANTCDTTAVSKEMQYHISLHSIAGEELDRRNVGEVPSNSRDPGKIVEGSQTSLSKLISEMHGLKTFENILLSK